MVPEGSGHSSDELRSDLVSSMGKRTTFLPRTTSLGAGVPFDHRYGYLGWRLYHFDLGCDRSPTLGIPIEVDFMSLPAAFYRNQDGLTENLCRSGLIRPSWVAESGKIETVILSPRAFDPIRYADSADSIHV
jgi:hypothetical protein